MMHEMTIAVSIVRMVAQILREHGAHHPISVRIRTGCMTGIVPEALVQAFSIAAPDELGCVPALLIDQASVVATCAESGNAFDSVAFPAICPQCDGVGTWLKGGDELELVSVEVNDDEDDRSQGTHP